MWNKFHKNKTHEVWRWWAIVLNKGDVLYAYATSEEHALERVFGNRDCWAIKHAVHCVTPCRLAVGDDLTVLGKSTV